MRTFFRLRTWAALTVGTAVGLSIWVLPPQPTGSAVLPKVDLETADGSRELTAVSSDGRFLVTVNGRRAGPAWVFCVWDRHRSLQTPIIEVPTEHGRGTVAQLAFSPDERTLAVASSYDVLVFDLAEGQKIKEYHLAKYARVFFSGAQLLYTAEHKGLTSFDMDTGKEMRRFEKEIGGFQHWHNCAEFLIYRKVGDARNARLDGSADRQVRIYSWLTGELQSTFTEPNTWIHFRAISHNGQVLLGQGNVPVAQGQDQTSYEFVTNAVTGVRRGSKHSGSGRWVSWLALSPDGNFIAKCGISQRPEWLAERWPRKRTIDVTHWETNECLASFEDGEYACFSRQGNLLAVQRVGGVIDLYDFPFRNPWSLISGAAIIGAAGSWISGWLWSLKRGQKVVLTT